MARVLKTLTGDYFIPTAMTWCEIGLVVGSVDGKVLYFKKDLESGGICQLSDCARLYTHKYAVSSVCYVNGRVYSCSIDGKLMVYYEQKAEEINTVTDPYFITSNNGFVYVGNLDGVLYKIEPLTQSIVETAKIFDEPIVCVDFYPGYDKGLALCSKKLVIFDANSLEKIKTLNLTTDECTSMMITKDCYTCLVTAVDGTIRVIDLVSFKEVGCKFLDIGELNGITNFDDVSRYLVVSSQGKACIFNSSLMIKESSIKVCKTYLKSVVTNPDNLQIAVAGGEKSITILDKG